MCNVLPRDPSYVSLDARYDDNLLTPVDFILHNIQTKYSTIYATLQKCSVMPYSYKEDALMKHKALLFLTLAMTLASQALAATLVGVNNQNALVTIDSANPAVIVNTAPITGVQTGEVIVSLDFDPNSGLLYGLSNLDRLFRIDPVTGVASLINASPFKKGINGNHVSLEVDPVIGDIRILDETGLNAVLNPVLGIVDGLLNLLGYPLGDPNFLSIPQLVEGAVDNLNLENPTGILYAVDQVTGSLVEVTDGLLGAVHTVAPIDDIVDLDNLIGFDIGSDGTALLAVLLDNGQGTAFYLLNLVDGTVQLLGSTLSILEDITIINPPPANEDTDGDGVPNVSDRCPDTPAGQIVDQFGCSIDQLCPCAGPRTGGPYKKKGYAKCVNAESKRFQKSGIITKVEAKSIKKSAKKSPCNFPAR